VGAHTSTTAQLAVLYVILVLSATGCFTVTVLIRSGDFLMLVFIFSHSLHSGIAIPQTTLVCEAQYFRLLHL